MNFNFDEVYQAALSLPDGERARLVDSLIATFTDGQTAVIDESWVQEIERRSAEIDAGTVELIPWEEVRQRVTARLKPNG